MSKRSIVLDTETTGLYADKGDRIIEFAGMEMIDRRTTGNNLQLYINPECEINPEAEKVHGISNAFLQDKPLFADVAQQIIDFVKGADLIIHNATFDISFLNAEFARLGLPKITDVCGEVIDTLKLAREQYPGQKNSLDALCTRLAIDRSKRVLHGALVDCELLSQVYVAMTQSQFALDIGLSSSTTSQNIQVQSFVRTQDLKVIEPTAEELKAYEAYLDELDKICAKGSVARRSKESLDNE